MFYFSLGKNEVTLEFHQHDDAQVSLMEMRFYIPGGDGSDVDPVKVSLLWISTLTEHYNLRSERVLWGG